MGGGPAPPRNSLILNVLRLELKHNSIDKPPPFSYLPIYYLALHHATHSNRNTCLLRPYHSGLLSRNKSEKILEKRLRPIRILI